MGGHGATAFAYLCAGGASVTDGIVALSGAQVRALVEDEFDGTGPCRVADTLRWTELAGTGVVPGARVMMEATGGPGMRLTAKGNLNRKLVEILMERSRWPGDDPAEVRSICKVVNEEDFAPAMYLHAVLRLAGLTRRERGFLKLTRKGEQLLPVEQAGQLQATLFRATFTRYNLAYLDRAGEPEVFAAQIGLILFLIGRFCTFWHPADELMRSVTLPMEQMGEPDPCGFDMSHRRSFIFTLRVLRYLCWFGLLEEAKPAGADRWTAPSSVRKTALYDRMLVFALE